MHDHLEILIIRLRKESPRKCSLTPLRSRSDLPIRWIHCDLGDSVAVGEVTLLHPEGEMLGPKDAIRPLLLVDSSWHDLPRMLRTVSGTFHQRRLPTGLTSAYPRRSRNFRDPHHGLASIEALYAAMVLLGHRDDSLLDGYHWAAEWLQTCHALLGR